MDWLNKWANTTQQKALVCLDTGKSFSYWELNNAARRVAVMLKNLFDVSKGSRVCVLGQNSWQHVILFFACQKLGALFVPLNFRLANVELDDVIDDANPNVVFASREFDGYKLSAKTQRVSMEEIEVWIAKESAVTLNDELDEDAPSLMLYTSGTTGRAKGVLISERAMFWNALNTALRLGLSFETRHLCFHPFFHASGWNVLTLPTLRFGGTVYLLSKFDAAKVLKLVPELKLNILFGVPTMLDRMAHCENFSTTDLSSLRFAVVGGEPMPLEAIRLWHKRGVPIRQGFGLTECGPNVFSLNAEDAERKLGSIGTPNFYVEARVVKDTGEVCGADEIGELQLRGPVCMAGYWNQPEATLHAFHDGWLKTGDLVSFDSDGFYFVRGRKKEMYISGGENVFPAEVERVLRACPGVREAAVIGVPDTRWGEVGCAFVVGTGEFSRTQFDAYVSSQLAKFKVPKHVRLLDELPKSESGKIFKRGLRELFDNWSSM